MSEFLGIIWNGLFSLTVPVINLTFKEFVIGTFIIMFLIDFVRRRIQNGGFK